MNIQTFKRCEKKFLLTTEQFAALDERLKEHMEYDAFCREGSYPILNIYFDNPNHDVIRRSVGKPYFKEKLRLRSYGVPDSGESVVYLELKRKIGGVVNKRRAKMTFDEAMNYLNNGRKPPKPDFITAQVLNEIDYFIDFNHVEPMYFLSYERIAMVGIEDKSFRLTVDKNILARRESLSLSEGCFGRNLIPPDKRLMEVKFMGAMPLDFADILSELGIFSKSFSKIGTEYNTYNSWKAQHNQEIKAERITL